MSDTAERVALVTGGARGIGRAVVEALLAEGWQVGFCSRSAESAGQTAAELAAQWPGRVAGEAVDVRRWEAVQAWVEGNASRHGRVDCLVNNAGLGIFAPVDEISPAAWAEVLETNLYGPFFATLAVAPVMRRQGEGYILNVGSLAARNPFAGGAAYNASKFGLLGLSEASMLDLRHAGIRVSCILPGSVDTDFHAGRRPEREWMLAPADVARAVVDLLRYPPRALPSLIELRPTRPPRH
jgi:NAD(P)-dependent dehydrogenase (short-subunit alcohol dehydrogenase family)